MSKKLSKTMVFMLVFDALLIFITIFFALLFCTTGNGGIKTLYVTFLTISYHFLMRIIVGETVTIIYRNRKFNLSSRGFRIFKFESGLYEKLKVKRWKQNVITARPEQFDLRKNSMDAVLHNTAQAELVHRIIMILSFAPLLLIIPYGAPTVFVITSVLASMIDLIFVIIQRYNRPRLIRIIKKHGQIKGVGSLV